MDRSIGSGSPEQDVAAAIEDAEVSSASQSPELRAPARREIIEIAASPDNIDAIAALVRREGAAASFTSDGQLGIRFPNGGLIVLSGTQGLAHILGVSEGTLLSEFNADQAAFISFLQQLKDGIGAIEPSATPGGLGGDNRWNSAVLEEPDNLGDESGSTYDENPSQVRLGGQMEAIGRVDDETARWGRDDLKRGEAGERGVFITTDTGEPLTHLVGLGDEEIGRRNGEKIISSDNTVFKGEETGVGSGVDHLWLLGDFEFQRASRDLIEGEDVFETKGENPKIWTPLEPIKEFTAVEDTPNSGQLFDPELAILPVVEREVTMDPQFGTITLGPDGHFDYTPAPGFSGTAIFHYTFVDPRNGKTVTGNVSITVEAVADPATIFGGAVTLEDTIVDTPITVDLNDPDGSEDIEKVVITGLPAGAVLDWDVTIGGSIVLQPDGTFVVNGSTAQIQALLQSLKVTPPHDFHGRISLDVAVTTIERNVPSSLPGYLDREVTHFTYNIDVTAVADLVTATGDDETTDEDVAVHLDNLAATFGDSLDGSETHIIEIRGVDPDARMQNASGVEYPFIIAADGTKTYTIDLSKVGEVYFLPPADESGTFDGMTIVAIATEGSNGDREIASAPIRVVVAPVADPLEILAPTQATDEDTPVTFGDDIDLQVLDPATQDVTEVIVSGFPAGTIVTYTPVGGGPLVTITMGAGGSVTLNGGTEAQIRAALSTLTLTPPPHTDQNIALTVTATTEDLGGVTDTRTVPMIITVAAVADGPNIAGNAEGNEDAPIDLLITVSRIDADGSESYKSASLTIPAGATLLYPGVLPNGITVSVVGNVTTFTPGLATTAAEFENFLATGLQIQAPADSDVNFDVAVDVTTIESVLSGGEVTLLEKTNSINVPVTVHPVIDMPSVSGASVVDEDTSVNFGANIGITENDKADGSEAITEIVLGNIPSSATVGYTTYGTVTVTPVTGGGITTYTITGGTEDDIRDTLASFTLTPPLHSDANIDVSVAITKVDQTALEGEAAVTTTDTHTHAITVNAVADGPTITGAASGNEDAPIDMPITVTRIDADGSEQYDFATITPPAGVTLNYPGVLPNGITVSVSGGAYTFKPGAATTAAQFESFLATGLQVQAPHDSDVNFNVTVKVGTIESVLTDSGLTLLRKDDTASVPVTVHPVIDAPAFSGASSVNEDGIVNPSNQAVTAGVNFGANIGITAPDGSDGSEGITEIVVTGLPIGAVVTYTPVGGASTTFTVGAGTTTITLNGGTDAEIRAALATLTLTPPPHSDSDIVLGIAVTKSDATGTEGEAAVIQTFNATHTITVAAVADIPTGSGSGAGNEDENIPVSISVGHPDNADGSETIKNVVIGNIPAGFSLSESSAGLGVLTLNGDGTYTVTGPSDAAINGVLANLTLVFAPGGARQHLDTEFNLSVTVTTIESAVGAGQNALPEASSTFNVPITVTAVADPVTPSGSSVIEEDVAETIGSNIAFTKVDADGTESVTTVTVSGFPAGTTVTYTPVGGGAPVSFVSTGANVVTLTGGTEAQIRAALDTLNVQAPLHSDVNFALNVSVTTTDNDASSTMTNFTHAVTVQAVADVPTLVGSGSGLEDQNIAVSMTAGHPDNADGTEKLKNVVIGNIPAGLSLSESSAGTGVLTLNGDGTYTVTGPNDAAINDVLANLTLVFASGGARQHLDTDFNLSVRVTTIESAPSEAGGGEVSVLETFKDFTVPVTVTAVADPVTPSGSSVIEEDVAETIGSNIAFTKVDADGTESVTTVTVSGFPAGTTVTYTPVGGGAPVSFVSTGANVVTLTGGTEAQIRAALDTLNVQAPLHSDVNFSLNVSVITTDNDASTYPTNFTHSVTVQAVADVPTLSGSGAGLEDQNIAVSMTAGHPDNADGTEKLKNVVIGNIPAGLSLTESSAGTGVLTLNGDGTYTVTGPNDAAINDVLANLTLVFAPGGARQHLDTDFNLSVRVTTIESAPSEAGGGEVSVLETFKDFTVPVTVTAVVDGVTQSGSSTIVEDVAKTVGSDIVYTRIDNDGSESVSKVEVSGFPVGSTVTYNDVGGAPHTVLVGAGGLTVSFTGGTEAEIRTAIDTLNVTSPLNSDVNFSLNVAVSTDDHDGSSTINNFTHNVVVQAVADTPAVSADAISFNEDATTTLVIRPDSSSDNVASDNSETLSVRITVPSDGFGVLGALSGTAPGGVTFTNVGGGVYTVTAAGADPATREALLDGFLNGGLTFTPRAQWSGVLTGTAGIKVEAISTEAASGGELAPNAYGGADNTSKTETVTTYIDVTVIPVNDLPVQANASTIVQENAGSSAIADPDLIIPIGTRIGLSIADTDGSQGLSLTLTGFPTNAQALAFGSSLAGVTTNVNIATGTVTISGANANNVITVLNSLSVTLADDRDQNFTVSITGTVTDTNGSTIDSDPVNLTHTVTVQAVADTPTVNVGAATKAFVNEDSNFVTYPVTTGLNDTDGSETYQSVVVQFSTAGAGTQPSVQFTVTTGVTFDNSVLGQVTLTGAAADIDAAMASLQVKPGAHNDADITIRVTATSVESSPAEDNNGAGAGMGGGVAGSEISVPTAQATQTFVIPVAAVADTPTGSGSGTGVEDQNIPVSITVGHADTADGSEKLKNVVIGNIPAGLSLTESSAGTGVLTLNGDGTYTVTGPNDAAISDVLANLSLVFAPGGARQHLDTDFNLSVTVTTIESSTSESGAGQGVNNEASTTFSVPITVTAVVDGVTQSGSSTIVEDVAKTVGSDIVYTRIDNDGSESVSKVEVSGFPVGSTVTYNDVGGAPHTVLVGAGGLTVSFTGGTEAEIRTAIDTLNVTSPLNSDVNFSLNVAVTTDDHDGSSTINNFTHNVVVQAVADTPAVSADAISLNEDATTTLVIRPDRSADVDNSETLSVRITVPSDGFGVLGALSGTAPGGVTFTNVGGGVYTVTAAGADPATREALLDGFLNGGLTFTPRAQWSGVLTGTAGIKVEAISTEAASGGELAPNAYGGADNTSKTETVTTYIDVTVIPVNDLPVQANASTIVQENAGSSAIADPDLIIPIGTRIGLSIADTDGSQGLSLTLTGFPTNAQALAFGSSLAGVTTNVNIATGTVTISGANANNVITVLNSLSVTLADDRDQNFTVSITGTVTDTNGSTIDSDPVNLTHTVTVQAVADTPTVNVGAATKAAVDEDSGYVTYAVTTGLNDTDGSETYQSVVVQFSTPGTGNRPEVNFTVTTGVTFDNSVPGQVTLTGAAADIDAAMASLQVRPGADNGEDITVVVTATSIESSPAEDNNGAGAGMGGGVAGAEISVPTAVAAQTFVIPVNPVPEVPILALPGTPSGAEDTKFALGAITVSSGSSDPDGSETRFIEIDTTSYPSGTVFYNGVTPVGTVVTPGWLRVTEAQLAALSIQAPLHYSGTINLQIRGVIVDSTTSGSITSNTAPQTLAVTVTPDADAVTPPAQSVGIEDIANIAVGADLANATTGIRVVDNGSGVGNNGATETISQIALDFPADTATLTYGITQGALVGSAQIAFDAGTRTYTITSTIITGAADVGALSQANRNQAEADIRATLAGFTVTMGPTHSDVNGAVAVTATTLDVNGGVANTQDNAFTHNIVVQAVADTPSVSVVDPAASSPEDSASILLTINAGNSLDVDNSETLSVRITIPSDGLGAVGTITGTPPGGVTVTNQGGGVYLVTATGASNAAREALLDSFLNGGGIAFTPRANWSGNLTGTNGIRVDVISTEAATGGELAAGSYGGADGTSATETVTDYIDIRVAPTADTPSVKGNAVGSEDALIPIAMSVTLSDKDGSETYVLKITGGVPPGAHIYGAGGAEITPDGLGVYTLTPADVSALAIRPPLNYSSALQGDIVLATQTVVTDTTSGGTVVQSFAQNINIRVDGVADQPGTRTVNVSGDEDQPIALGAAILSSAGGNLNNLLVDADGSEALSFVIGGLPAGVIPTSSVPGGVTYIGNGTWSITAAAMPTLQLPPVPNFSGENPYSGVTVRAVTQEIDGDQSTSPQWPVTIQVNPVIAAATVDGFSSWNMGVQQQEGATEGSGAISLASVTNHTFVDNDGSESVVSYTFDLNSLIANAGIAAQLASLPGAGSGLDKLAANYISGTFTYNAGAGTITVQAANIGGVALSGALFLDSNQDFSLPVSALVRDTAIIGGSPVSVDKTEGGTFAVDLVGSADVPTAFATGNSGPSGTQLPITLGGVSTDADVALGRTASEDIYYVVSVLNPGTAPPLGFTDGAGNIVGLANGDGTWMFTPAELVNIHVTTPGGAAGTAHLKLTTVATENDGDVATNSTNFDVVVSSLPGGGGTAPEAPTVTIGSSNGSEDGSATLNVGAAPAAGDTTNPSVAVMIWDLPAGAQVIGARYNPETGRWVASAAAVNSNAVQIIPPDDFSGTMNFKIEGVATNASLLQASTGPKLADAWFDPVADGVVISAAPGVAAEDAAISLNLNLAERDIDGSEDIGSSVYISLNNGATLLGGYPVVGAGDPDATYGSTSVVGYYRVPLASVPTLQIQGASNWHGNVDVTVAAYSVDPEVPVADADNTLMETAVFQVSIPAVANAPIVSVPAVTTGTEDTPITIAGLSAALADTNAANGAEVLSVKIEGVPFGSVFSAGSNNGDGSWTIPLSALGTLSITPPLNYSGTMTLTLTAIALELSNGDEAQTSMNFDVTVNPRADTVEILANNVAMDATASVALALNVRMADVTGTNPGENAPETIRVTFTAVPTGVSLSAAGGGAFTNPSSGTWVFTGSQAQANAILALASATATGGTYTVNLSAVTIDGSDTLAAAVTDSFQLVVPQVLAGTAANDTLTGGSGTQLLYGLGGNDSLVGGAGNDHMAGAAGNDTYVVDSAGDVIVEVAGQGTADAVQTALAAYTLAAEVERLSYTGGGDFAGTGNTLANQITSGIGNDTLDGGAGADTLTGGSGNDTYIVSEAGDSVVEGAGGGTDVVQTAIGTYTLAADVENLTFTGSGAFAGTGNTGDNQITGGTGADALNGGAGNDTLNGGSGSDMLTGGTGNDVFIVDDAGDSVVEGAGGGTADEVQTNLATYTLAAEVERLTFTGAGAFTGTGNSLANTIAGGSSSDTITGRIGADTMSGGSGADTFDYVSGDLGAGVDTVTDFTAGAGGDALDIAALLVGFNPATSILTDFVQLSAAAGNTTVRVDANGGGDSFQDLVILQGVTGLDVNTMKTNANLIV